MHERDDGDDREGDEDDGHEREQGDDDVPCRPQEDGQRRAQTNYDADEGRVRQLLKQT